MDAEPSVETSNDINDDTVLGGFTVIGRKIRCAANLSREVLPSWITNATMFSHDLNIRQSVQDITELTHDTRSRLIELGYTELFPGMLLMFTDQWFRSLKLLAHRTHTFVRALVIVPVRDLAAQVIDEADRVIVEEKQDWYRLLEDALYHFNVLAFDTDTQPEPTRPAKRIRSKPVLSIMNQYDISHDLTLQKILVSATLTHDPGPLKRFNLYFPHLITSSPRGQATLTPILMNGLDQKQNSGRTTSNDLNDSSVREMNDQQVIDAEMTATAVGGVGIFSTPCGLREHVVCVTQEQRTLFLLHLVRHKHIKRILCFTNARIITKRLSLLLQNVSGIKVSPISAEMPPNKRQHVLQAFSRGDLDILVCTDSMARGMDIKGVQCVVSYEMPLNVKTYVHRIGRTARAGQTGLAFTLLLRNQFFHFKKELRSVGKTKLKEVPFHGSHMADLRADYAKALKLLEASVKKDSQSATDRSTKVLGTISKQLDSNKNSAVDPESSGEARRQKKKTHLRSMDEKQ
ncbi:ATP-dependent RNA helicase DDX51/DBP6 [Paragonimus westermani]|uniref:ATP-dependent RNA helicase DDX51/DBP6 n=1 Tax=Paragonimus westermani TaxID=34504 RepID=A0A5J4P4Q0_9TREM|nr:ATP-dependent RNA helicase DDX51/DBP6 [Paragonimus westermani]